MGLDMGLFKINKKIESQEELKDTVIKINNFNYVERNLQEFKKLNQAINKSKDTISLIEQVKDNKLIKKYNIKQDINTVEGIKSYIDKILINRSVYADYLHVLGFEEELLEIEKITYWRKYYDLDNYFERLFEKKDISKEFRGTPLLLSKEDLKDAIKTFKKSDCEHKEEIVKSLTDAVKGIDFKKETLYYECW